MERCVFLFLIYFLPAASFGLSSTKWMVLRDSSKALTIDDILEKSDQFTHEQSSFLNFAFTEDAIWIRSQIEMSTGGAIFIDNPLIRYVDFYLIENDSVRKKVHIEYQKNLATNEVEQAFLKFDIPYNFSGEIFMRFESTEPLILPISIIPTNQIANTIAKKKSLGYVSAGAVLTLALLYLIFFISIQERIYFLYWIYVLTVIITVLRINGLFYYWLPFMEVFNDYTSVFETLPAIAAGFFTIQFLQLKKYEPFISKVIYIMVTFQVLSLFITFFGFNSFAYLFTDLIAFIFIPIALVIGYKVWIIHKFKPAKYYLLSWIFLFVGSITFLLRNYGYLYSDSVIINHSVDLGITIEMILLAVGLSKRIDLYRIEKEKLQTENIKILEDQRLELEYKVSERTKELEAQNEEIIQQQEEIVAINEKLEDTVKKRTLQLENQNKVLLDYAYYNAHKVRGPLARILGLTYLLKNNSLENGQETINNIDSCARELDTVIQKVNNTLSSYKSLDEDSEDDASG